jgi:hypothetical protein
MENQRELTRICGYCRGAGKINILSKDKSCATCGGRGSMPRPDYSQILRRILSTRKPGSLVATFPATNDKRAYYVWRMLHFQSQAKPEEPILAMQQIEGDPYLPELDRLIDEVSKYLYAGKKLREVIQAMDAISSESGERQASNEAPARSGDEKF